MASETDCDEHAASPNSARRSALLTLPAWTRGGLEGEARATSPVRARRWRRRFSAAHLSSALPESGRPFYPHC